MIGKIKGKLSEIEENIGLIETAGGTFYEVFLPSSLLPAISPGESIEIYTYLQVRDDAQILFGFQNKNEHNIFKLLLSVPGVGPKTAFAIISHIKVDELFQAVKNNDVDFFSKIPGLGKKTAMKILLELSGKLDQEFKLEKMYLTDEEKTVVEALISLGFRSSEAKQILFQIPKDLSLEEKIKTGIKLATNPQKKV
ncbi:MAG: Holliday junction branch migration protein RuvA [Candidatus Roizmanbacteria bacterium]|nr:MAG: Holliday junction branch migration protein RuvA [Candidatus Roizmanbacteria bacterium]